LEKYLKDKRILFIVSEDWYFYTHRISLAKIAINSGCKIGLLSNFTNHKEIIEVEGVKTFSWVFNRKTRSLLTEIESFKNIISTIKKFKPNIIHAVALKPVFYSAISCSIIGFNNIVYAIAGLGYLFTSKKKTLKIIRPLVKIIFKIIFMGSNTKLILQNSDDKGVMLKSNLIKRNKIKLIRGAGVDTKVFSYKPILLNNPLVILPARMIWSKGIGDFVECAKIIKKNNNSIRFALIGMPDPQNPDSIPVDTIKQWTIQGLVEWWGHQDNMHNIYHKSTIVCLPTTYGEGLPKALLEAASCGRPIITYDVPGCREIVKDGFNGFLVKPGEIKNLVESLEELINSSHLCNKMGKNGRLMVKKEFNQEKIALKTFSVWEELLSI
jgi:glycosyltransferase involved in cell wall biosynthesis